ncbi:MAG: aminoglycoside phosphotransferase family protein [Chthoniobacterales bacterium]|nr:aminoglycoside phosphotransferase family protein [Chthoniobacterales bacterium]
MVELSFQTEHGKEIPLQAVGRLLSAAGLSCVDTWTPVRDGGNNRVYSGQSANQKLLLKLYFHTEGDSRDRLRGERCFYELAEKAGVSEVPKALGWDIENRIGLFAFVEGRKVEPGAVTADHVSEAANLVVRVNNALEQGFSVRDWPTASEACFSFAEHLATVDGRVSRLESAAMRDDLDKEAVIWIRDELVPRWHRAREEAARRAADADWDLEAALPLSQRWISPSDFGFHNVLVDAGGFLKFFDFEYAGWDDPAKLAADFFCQPGVPVPLNLWEVLGRRLAECHRWTPETGHRARLLLPVYRIKWCCIMLNEFLPAEARRRGFSHAGAGDRRAAQLRKARAALQQMSALG